MLRTQLEQQVATAKFNKERDILRAPGATCKLWPWKAAFALCASARR
jgi:hypothetical protein